MLSRKKDLKFFHVLTITAFSVAGLIAFNRVASAADTIETTVEAALLPEVGFDDNDSVSVVLHGTLPNHCYSLAKADAKPSADGKAVVVRQFVTRKTDGICGDQDAMPDYFRIPFSFNTELNLGTLQPGQYEIRYRESATTQGKTQFSVGRSPVMTVDSYPYAAASNVIVPDMVSSGIPLEITITGLLTASCYELKDSDIRVQKEDKVFVVLPILSINPNVPCSRVVTPFQRKIKLGRIEPGHHLIHVRSTGGIAVNRVVEAVR